MKKLPYLLIILLAGCNGGGNSPQPKPNSITATATSLNNVSYTDGSAAIAPIISNAPLLSLLNSDGNIWSTDYTGSTPSWAIVPALPLGYAAALATNNIYGVQFACSESGNCYEYLSSTWTQQGGSTEVSPATSMLITNGNTIYMGNAAGHVWVYNNISWVNISGGSGITAPIVQLAVDNINSPAYLGVASGTNVYAYQIGVKWVNLTEKAGSSYTDAGSNINSIGFYISGNNDYGYIANSSCHVWRAIYDTSTATVQSFINMSTYPGYTCSGSGGVTQVAVDSNNNVYAGTQSGQVLIWTPSTVAWSNITPNGSNSAITTIGTSSNNTIFVGNQTGQMWSINWN